MLDQEEFMNRFAFPISIAILLLLSLIVHHPSFAEDRLFDCPPSALLTNDWQYCWSETADFSSIPDSEWTDGTLRHINTEADDHEWLWLRVSLPQGEWLHPSIYIDGGLRNRFEAFFAGEKIYEFSRQWFSVWHLIALPDDYDNAYIYFRFEPYYKRVGLYEKIYIGDSSCLLRTMIKGSLDSAVLGFVSVILGLISFVLFIFRKSKRETAYLSLGVFLVLMGCYMFSKSNIRLIVFDHPEFWFYIELISLYAIPGATFWFYNHIFEQRKTNITIWITRGLFIFFVITLLLEAIGLVSIRDFLPVVQISILLEVVYIISTSIYYSIKGDVESKLFTAGFILLSVFVVYNILSAMQIVLHPKSTVYWGFFALEISFAFIIFRRFANLHRQLQSYSEELEDMNRYLTDAHSQLENSNERLEETVQQRTAELSFANEELALHNHNMLKQIKMAQRIQEHLILQPHQYPHSREIAIGSRYDAVETIGGDLYDVIHAGKNALGVLMADVSGHGISAALITSMIKVAFNSEIYRGKMPAEVIADVNQYIYQFIGDLEYYLTAYYGYIDLEKGIFHYCSAGHFPALLFNAKYEEVIELKTRGVIMGALLDVFYETQSVQLQEGDRVLVYTDGIVESRNRHNEYYEMTRLKEYIFMHKKLPVQKFVDGLIDDVIEFSEGFPAEDDRAVLCFEFKKRINS